MTRFLVNAGFCLGLHRGRIGTVTASGDPPSSLDIATALGTNSAADALFGNGDLATAINTGSTADLAQAGGTSPAVLGSNDIAFVLGPDSSALAGANLTAIGDFDLAAVFGDMLHAIATGGNFLTDILP